VPGIVALVFLLALGSLSWFVIRRTDVNREWSEPQILEPY
jgi:hypothetical protein